MPGVVIDISEKAAGDPTATLEAEDLENWESQHGPLPHGGVVLLRTGWGKFYYTDYSKYLGTDTNQAEDMRSVNVILCCCYNCHVLFCYFKVSRIWQDGC